MRAPKQVWRDRTRSEPINPGLASTIDALGQEHFLERGDRPGLRSIRDDRFLPEKASFNSLSVCFGNETFDITFDCFRFRAGRFDDFRNS